MELLVFLQQDWLFNKKHSNEAFRTHLEKPPVRMSRASPTLVPGGGKDSPIACPGLGIASAAGLGPRGGEEAPTSGLCLVVGNSLE